MKNCKSNDDGWARINEKTTTDSNMIRRGLNCGLKLVIKMLNLIFFIRAFALHKHLVIKNHFLFEDYGV